MDCFQNNNFCKRLNYIAMILKTLIFIFILMTLRDASQAVTEEHN